MVGVRMLGLVLLWVFTSQAVDLKTGAQEYHARRVSLIRATGESLVVLFGATEPLGGSMRTGFEQEANFRYLTGWEEPGAVLVMWSSDAGTAGGLEEALLLPARNPNAEKWTGRKWAPGDPRVSEATGFRRVEETSRLEELLKEVAVGKRKVLTLLKTAEAGVVGKIFPGREVSDVSREIARLRMNKSAAEVESIRRSIAVTIKAQRAAWRRVRPGMWEYQLSASLVGQYLEEGCNGAAFRPVIGAGTNSTVMHSSRHRAQLKEGELVVIDTGAECAGYAADLTRTLPVSGRFNARQRQIYNAVLEAQNAVLRAVKPGMTLGREEKTGLYVIAQEALRKSGIEAAGKLLSEYFTHGIGHHVGLEVHDAFVADVPLEAGMVITVEPGVYLPEEQIGVRIEDMVLVTDKGGMLLSGGLAREGAAVERLVRH